MGAAVHLPALPVIVPLLTAPLLLLLQARLAWAAASAASLCALGASLLLLEPVSAQGFISYAMGDWAPPYGIELRVDAFSLLLLLVTSGASAVALLTARASIDSEIAPERQHLFYCAWLLALAGLNGIAVAGDAFNIFVLMEISSLATYVLVAGGSRRETLKSVFKYLVMGTLGATCYLIGVGLIYMMTGTLNLADMAERLPGVASQTPILLAGGFITVGLALKAAVFPLHTWLPNAYSFAPNAVTVFLAACSTKIALYVLVRFDLVVFQPTLAAFDGGFISFLLPLALLAVLFGSIKAVYEKRLKHLLAFSSVAQIGYIVAAAGIGSATALAGGITHMFNHALAKATLFLALLALANRGTTLSLQGVAGAAHRHPWVMGCFVVGALSLVGIPGTAGFIGKWYLLVGAVQAQSWGFVVAVVVLLGSLLSVLYMGRVVQSAYLRTEHNEAQEAATDRLVLPLLLLLAVANIFFGLWPQLPLTLAADAAQLLSLAR